MKNNQFHINFKLNGTSFSNVEELIEFSNQILTSITQFLQDWFSSDDFINVKTSGSTGKPKTIQLKKEFMKNSAEMTGEFFNIKQNTTALLCLSTDYIAGKMMLVRALVLGWNLDCIEPNSNPLENNSKNYDFAAFVPLQVENSLENIHQIKKLIVGGGKVSKSLQAKIQNIPTQIFATYGMTETITHIALKKINHLSLRGRMTKKSHDVNEITSQENAGNDDFYQTLPNIKISKDQRNCLVINAPKLADEKIVTNDSIELISETAFKLLGRIDNVINSGGIKLHPEIIEDKLAEIIEKRFFVTGIPDEIFGERLVLVIEKDVISTEMEKSFKERISTLQSLSKFEIPKEIYFVDCFIETETKKIQRKSTLQKIFPN